MASVVLIRHLVIVRLQAEAMQFNAAHLWTLSLLVRHRQSARPLPFFSQVPLILHHKASPPLCTSSGDYAR